MASGISVNKECIDAFQELKLKKNYLFIICKINPTSTEIVLDKAVEKPADYKTRPKDEIYQEFVDTLPEDECRWVIYDFEYEKEGGGQRSKISFISWSPDVAKIKVKMLYASSRDALKRSLNGVAVEIQGSDHSEVSYESVLEKASRGN